MNKMGLYLIYFVFCNLVVNVFAALCSEPQTGYTPIYEMIANETYLGYSGFLYQGSNSPPPPHLAMGMTISDTIEPLDAFGNPSASGKIVIAAAGMSMTEQMFYEFVPLITGDTLKRPEIVAVNTAQGGIGASDMSNILNAYWTDTVPVRLSAAGVTADQVQVVFLHQSKEGGGTPQTDPFPNWAQNLQSQMVDISQHILTTYPNVKIVIPLPRIYAGYATTNQNEPFGYEQGFAVKWLIDLQVDGDLAVNYDPAVGPVKTGIFFWGPYWWADGVTPNVFGDTWLCPDDYATDGIHPSDPVGRLKMSNILLDYFQTDSVMKTWYLAGNSTTTGTSTTMTTSTTTTNTPIGLQCDAYNDINLCLDDCECGGCLNGAEPVENCESIIEQAACEAQPGTTWYPPNSPCTSTSSPISTSSTSILTTSTTIPTSSTTIPTSSTTIPTTSTTIPTSSTTIPTTSSTTIPTTSTTILTSSTTSSTTIPTSSTTIPTTSTTPQGLQCDGYGSMNSCLSDCECGGCWYGTDPVRNCEWIGLEQACLDQEGTVWDDPYTSCT